MSKEQIIKRLSVELNDRDLDWLAQCFFNLVDVSDEEILNDLFKEYL